MKTKWENLRINTGVRKPRISTQLLENFNQKKKIYSSIKKWHLRRECRTPNKNNGKGDEESANVITIDEIEDVLILSVDSPAE